MKRIISIAILCVTFASGAADYCFDEPLRVVNSQRLNLKPLFEWWQETDATKKWNMEHRKEKPKAIAPRPHPTWARITCLPGVVAPAGWEIEAEVTREPGWKTAVTQKILLRHPPFQAKARFDHLVQEIAEVSNAATSASASANAISSRQQEYQRRAMDAEIRIIRDVNLERSHETFARIAPAQNRAASLRERLAVLEAEFKKLPREGNSYKLDTFAFCTGEFVRGLPVYDMGMVIK